MNGVSGLDQSAIQKEFLTASQEEEDTRIAPRITLLIRAAKLISSQGEFICVIRDVSSTGVSLRLFHALPKCDHYALEFQAGQCLDIHNVWERGSEGGFEFVEPIEVTDVVNEVGNFPKRGVRLDLEFPVTIATLSNKQAARVQNLSQQGARVTLDGSLAIDQSVRIKGPGLSDVRAKVRWRRDGEYGLVFDDTFSLGDFALLAARLQCPMLLR